MGTRMDKESFEHNLHKNDITLIIGHNFSPTSNPPIKPKDSEVPQDNCIKFLPPLPGNNVGFKFNLAEVYSQDAYQVRFNFLSSSFLLVYLFFVPFVCNQTYYFVDHHRTRKFKSTTYLGDYSRPSHKGYQNAIELPKGAKVSPLQSDTIRLVRNGCTFQGLMFEDPIQHLRDFLRIVDSIDLNGATRNTTRLRLFYFFLRDQAIKWLNRLPAESISTWDDLTTHFLAQFFPPGRTAKLLKDILMFQQHKDKSLCDAWTRFKDLLRKVPHHCLDLWLQVHIFYDHVDYTT
nr:zinc finger, CCHC-type [Tanacetum cinerariifolium]